jgi:hypothetical protein
MLVRAATGTKASGASTEASTAVRAVRAAGAFNASRAATEASMEAMEIDSDPVASMGEPSGLQSLLENWPFRGCNACLNSRRRQNFTIEFVKKMAVVTLTTATDRIDFSPQLYGLERAYMCQSRQAPRWFKCMRPEHPVHGGGVNALF